MAVSDHLKPGLSTRARVKIMTVDVAQRRVEGVLKDGAMIQIAIWDVPSAFVWPKEGEIWIVRRDAGMWVLENRQQQTQDESAKPITELSAGQMMLDSPYIVDRMGNKLLTTADGCPAMILILSTQHGTDYTFTMNDMFTVVECIAHKPVTFTIPTYEAVRWPKDAMIEVFQYGSGQVTIGAYTGVKLLSYGGFKTAGQYATIGLRQRATDEWVLSGDLSH